METTQWCGNCKRRHNQTGCIVACVWEHDDTVPPDSDPVTDLRKRRENWKASQHDNALQTDAILDLADRLDAAEQQVKSAKTHIHEHIKWHTHIDKPSPEYCTCGETETWFDRSMTTDEQGNVIQDMCDRCVKCGGEMVFIGALKKPRKSCLVTH